MTQDKQIQTQQQDWGVSYGDLVKREFKRNWLNVGALGFIGVLFLIAIFAPFLANDKPFAVTLDGQTRYPLFQSLQWVDYVVLWAAALGAGFLYAGRCIRRAVDPSSRGTVHGWTLLAVVVLFVGGSVALKFFVPERLDATDYHRLVAQGKAEDAVFPLVPYHYARTDLKNRELPPSSEHWLGTDDVGADVLCRLIHGSRISLAVGFVAVGISSIIGVFVGALMGYFGGKVDFVGMRFVEIMMAIPKFFLIITIVAFFQRSLLNIMIIIGITSWTGDARFVRAEFLRLRKGDFVQAARALGLPLYSILFRHMLPNGIAPVLVNATFGVAAAIFVEAALSFLGFGVAPPTPSWGQMLSLGINTSGQFLWWLTLFPGLAIFFTVTAYNLVGEGLRDAIDPRMRKAA